MTRRRRTTDPDGALTTLMLQTLLVLSEDECHGYAILQEIEQRTDTPFEIGAATLYRTIKRLVDAGLIEETERRDDEHSQRRRYRITSEGRERAALEAQRLDELVRWARTSTVLPQESR